jgi:hypothetical protein
MDAPMTYAAEALRKYGHLSQPELREAWRSARDRERELIERLAVYRGWMDAPPVLQHLYPPGWREGGNDE